MTEGVCFDDHWPYGEMFKNIHWVVLCLGVKIFLPDICGSQWRERAGDILCYTEHRIVLVENTIEKRVHA